MYEHDFLINFIELRSVWRKGDGMLEKGLGRWRKGLDLAAVYIVNDRI